MGYAEIYRKRMSKGRRAFRVMIFCIIIGALLYFSIRILSVQSGSSIGGVSDRRSGSYGVTGK
jgi:hypothetical protein